MFNFCELRDNRGTTLWSCSGLLRLYLRLQYAHTALLDPRTVIAFLCYNVLMELYIPLASLEHPVRVWVKYWHSLLLQLKKCLQSFSVQRIDEVFSPWSTWPLEWFVCWARAKPNRCTKTAGGQILKVYFFYHNISDKGELKLFVFPFFIEMKVQISIPVWNIGINPKL